jgi:hypothetical protein
MATRTVTQQQVSTRLAPLFRRDQYGEPTATDLPARQAAVRIASSLASANLERPRVLMLAANPKGTEPLALDREQRKVIDELRQSQYGDQVAVVFEPAGIWEDLAFYLLTHTPTIVHFSGHGLVEGIALEDRSGNAHLVPTSALEALFAEPHINQNLRLVVLNSCFSLAQAEAIVAHVDAVIGNGISIPDDTAIEFARSLYMALGRGLDVAAAFRLARAGVMAGNIGGEDIPRLLSRPGVDPSRVTIFGSGVAAPDAPPVEIDEAATAALVSSTGVRAAGDRAWQWQGSVRASIEYVHERIREALQTMSARSVTLGSRNTLVARFGGFLPMALDATEEVRIELSQEDAATTSVHIVSRSIQMQVSDWGRNEGHIRLLLSLLGLS